MNSDFLNELIDSQYNKTIEQSSTKNDKQNNEIDALMKVFEYGSEFWTELYNWGNDEKIWNKVDIDFLNLGMNIDKKVPTDKQAIKILDTLEKARTESFPK